MAKEEEMGSLKEVMPTCLQQRKSEVKKVLDRTRRSTGGVYSVSKILNKEGVTDASQCLCFFFFLRIYLTGRAHKGGGAEGDREAGSPLSRESTQDSIPGP